MVYRNVPFRKYEKDTLFRAFPEITIPEITANEKLKLKTECQGQRDAQVVKALAAKLQHDLSSNPRTHMMETENQLPQGNI